MTCLGFLDPEHTAAAFDEDGWLRTGDLGVIDDEGYVTITGRLKDVIIRKGENISAKEVEDLLHPHPAITDVAVIGLPDAARGELACAVVGSGAGRRRRATGPPRRRIRAGKDFPRTSCRSTWRWWTPSPQRDAAEGAQVQAAGALHGAVR